MRFCLAVTLAAAAVCVGTVARALEGWPCPSTVSAKLDEQRKADIEDLTYRLLLRECPATYKPRYYAHFTFPTRAWIRPCDVLALYAYRDRCGHPSQRQYWIRGRCRVLHVGKETTEVQAITFGGLNPNLGWIDERWEPGRGIQYLLSLRNHTDLPERRFRQLMAGEYWRGMHKGYFACVMPAATEVNTHEERRWSVEEWVYGVYPHCRHFFFHGDQLHTWRPEP